MGFRERQNYTGKPFGKVGEEITTVIRVTKALLVVMFLSACGQDGHTSGQPGAQEERVGDQPTPVKVSAIRPEERNVVEPIIGTGTMASARTSGIGPIIEGILEEIHVRVGDRVEKGTPLFEMRRDHLLIQQRELENAMVLAQAEADRATMDLGRVQKLRETGVASTAHLDRVTSEHKTAVARLGMAQAALDRIKQDLDDSVVRAPFRGVVTERFKDEGVYLSNRLSGLSNSAVVEIKEIQTMVAVVLIPEKYLPDVHVGTKAKLFIDGIDGARDSEVHILNDRVDAASRSLELRLGLRNDDYAVKPGLFVRAEILPEPAPVTLLERRALLGPPNDPYIFVNDGGIAQRQSVRVRDFDSAYVQVVDGLRPTAEVLVGANLRLVENGAPIDVETRHVAR